MIDAPAPKGDDINQPLPADAHIGRFGGGQTETELEPTPDRHTLQLTFGDGNHVPHDPPLVSKMIHIEVE